MKYEDITLQQCILLEKKSGYPIICDGDKKIVYIKDVMQYIEKISKELTPTIQTLCKYLIKTFNNLAKMLSTINLIKYPKRYYKIKKGKKIIYKIK